MNSYCGHRLFKPLKSKIFFNFSTPETVIFRPIIPRGQSGGGVGLITFLHFVPRVRVNGVLAAFPPAPSSRVQ